MVNSVLEQNQEKLAQACREFGVERLELFGSAARNDFDPRCSDFDFIVRFRDPDTAGYADRYLAFAETLEQILGRRVDLITERSLRNPLLLREIQNDRIALYAA